MKIKSVKIKNFRSIKNTILEFPENGLISIIGPNNAGKSNFLKAIDLVLGENWNNGDKLEDYDYYCGDRSKEIIIEITFTDGKKVIFNSNESWPKYFDSNGDKKYGNVKDDFPCTYLSAERSIAKDTAFTKWSLMGKISKSFNKSINDSQKQALKSHFDGVKEIFSGVELRISVILKLILNSIFKKCNQIHHINLILILKHLHQIIILKVSIF